MVVVFLLPRPFCLPMQIGHLPRDSVRLLSTLIDGGFLMISGRVLDCDGCIYKYPAVISCYVLPGTEEDITSALRSKGMMIE